MPKKIYYLDQTKTESIELNWKAFSWKNFTIAKDGQIIGEIENATALKEGRSFNLPNGQLLAIRLKRIGIGKELEILLDGKPVPGSPTDPVFLIKTSFIILLVIGGFNLLAGALITGYDIRLFNEQVNMGVGLLIVGVLYIILSFLVKLTHSLIALYFAIAILILDIFLTISSGMVGTRIHTSGIIIKLIFIIQLFRGVSAIRTLKKEQQKG